MRNTVIIAICGIVLAGSIAAAQGQPTDEQLRAARHRLVELDIAGAGVKNERVLQAMRDTLRHEFIPRNMWNQAYLDAGLPIGDRQTISSPFIVAFMTEAIDPQPTDRVLEIGTGSGYQAAILSPLVADVYTIEIVEALGLKARRTLERLKYRNVYVKIGDGYEGWEEHAPFDKIIVTCSPENVPQPLVEQLVEGGLMVIPVGERHQQTLHLFRKVAGELETVDSRPTLFVPMTGLAEDKRQVLPDPGNPQIVNGDFETAPEKEGVIPGWYYERMAELEIDASAPSGSHIISFRNAVAGQRAHLMQGLALDGRLVSRIDLSAMVRFENVAQGADRYDLPVVAITFYDQQRREVSTDYLGPFQGSGSWRNYTKRISVPVGSREAIVRIGLFGATGRISFDNIVINKVD
ncbi:MAG TPA: protein-L-isoaspartate(D-aspartate) O-methyltransferase [Pirellulaceae bacterium]|nr:protein-L-isoaspartate(D-aspartate) O-methyltransferase [Pirellulaceae bacterium]